MKKKSLGESPLNGLEAQDNKSQSHSARSKRSPTFLVPMTVGGHSQMENPGVKLARLAGAKWGLKLGSLEGCRAKASRHWRIMPQYLRTNPKDGRSVTPIRPALC